MERVDVSVYDFVNYRTFFRSVYEELKFRDAKFSYRTIQKLAGFSHNSNHFWQILEGRRPISETAAVKYGKVFGLNTRELKYLKLMVQFDLAKTDDEKNSVLDKMRRSRNFVRHQQHTMKTYEMFADWYLPILWDMVDLDAFKEDYKWISQHSFYDISPALAEKGIKKLLQLGFLDRDDNGKLKKSVDSVYTHPTPNEKNPIVATAERNYLRKSMELSLGVIDRQPADRRLLIASTLLMSKEEVVILRQKLIDMVRTINAHSNKTGKDRLYQLNLQYFSLMKLEQGD